MDKLVAGVDEAGRGSFLGRVYAGCVIWDDKCDHKWLKDSKKLSKEQRLYMRDFIIENCISWGIGYNSNTDIDNFGIVKATMNAMHKSIDNLNIDLDYLYIDGNYFQQYKDVNYECIIKGDSKFKSISAASILAKTFHDDHICNLCIDNKLNEKYNLLSNMGYGTKNHINGLKLYGISKYHRKTFIKNYI